MFVQQPVTESANESSTKSEKVEKNANWVTKEYMKGYTSGFSNGQRPQGKEVVPADASRSKVLKQIRDMLLFVFLGYLLYNLMHGT